MAYIKKTYDLGATIEIEKVRSGRYGKHTLHKNKVNVTEDDVSKVNERNAEKKLRRLINYNFKPGDLHLVLTYKPECRPERNEAKKILSKFIKDLRKEYKLLGCELKYVHVTEYKHTIHHHFIINAINKEPGTLRLVNKIWGKHGRPKLTVLDETGDYAALAHYLIKETSKTFKEFDTP